MNAKEELLEHIKDRKVKYIKIVKGSRYDEDGQLRIEGSLESVIDKLNFDYDGGYGGQELFGFIWYEDGTWSERGEYDGSEWWRHVEMPSIDIEICDL